MTDPWAAWCSHYVDLGRYVGIIVDDLVLTYEQAGPDAYVAFDQVVVGSREELLRLAPSAIFDDMRIEIDWFARWLQDRESTATQAELIAVDNVWIALRDHCDMVVQAGSLTQQ